MATTIHEGAVYLTTLAGPADEGADRWRLEVFLANGCGGARLERAEAIRVMYALADALGYRLEPE